MRCILENRRSGYTFSTESHFVAVSDYGEVAIFHGHAIMLGVTLTVASGDPGGDCDSGGGGKGIVDGNVPSEQESNLK